MKTDKLEVPVEVRIPFPGFYESLLSSMIHDFERDEAEYEAQKYGPEDKQSELREALINEQCRGTYLDYRKSELAICEAYAELFAYELKKLTDVEIRYAFSELRSPKEYNFATDRVCLYVEREDMLAILEKVRGDLLDATAKKMFTSYDGFCSYYSPDVDSWGEPDGWTPAQWYCVLMAAQDLHCGFQWKDAEWYYYGINSYELLMDMFDYDKFRAMAKAKAAELGMTPVKEDE